MPRRAVFLDLNGTLVLPVQAGSLDEYREVDGAGEAVRALCAAGFVCPVVTIQSRIGKGLYSEDAFRAWFAGAARALGARACLVRTGWGPKPGDPLELAAHFVGDDLVAVARWILGASAVVPHP